MAGPGLRFITLEEGWNNEIKPRAIDMLESVLDSGMRHPFPPGQFMPIYTICYNMCTQRSPYNWSAQLYIRHGETISNYLSLTVMPALRDKHDEYLLQELTKRWANHKIMNKWMSRFFMYLDRFYVKHHSLPPLTEAGLKLFKNIVYDVFKRDAVNAMLVLINRERDGEMIDRDLLRSCIEIFEVMGMGNLEAYCQDFEEALLQSTTEYYARKSQEWIDIHSTPDYMIKAEEALNQESQRISNYLNAYTEPKLLRVCTTELLQKHARVILDKEGSGCIALLQNDKLDDLSRMYRLFSKFQDGLVPMAALVRQHIEAMGHAIVDKREATLQSGEKDSNSDPTFVKDLLSLHDKYKEIVVQQFNGNSLFQKALKEAFSEFVNRDVGKFTNAEMISSFCDRLLKTGGEKMSDEQVEEFLEKVVQLFSYLTDKDLFAEIYRNQLAKRLLNQRSSSDDAERIMIGKLKFRCGAQFTGKMEGMLNDLTVAADHQSDFEQYVKKEQADTGKIDFSVQVLTTGYWPTYKTMDLILPPSLVKCLQVFQQYYDSKTSHRRISWAHELGNAVVKAEFGKKSYDLQVTTLQAVCLMLFNENTAMSFNAVKEAINLPDETVKRILHSLSCGKYKILVKDPQGKSINATDNFTFNDKFSNPMRKFRIPMASLTETHNPTAVDNDRSIAIEAAIVRIMKARKTCAHQQLLTEVLAQLSFFKPNPKVVKRRIEALIEREYLERDPSQQQTYRYLA